MKSWREECAVFGVWNHEEAARLAYLGLYAMQHRGQESAGIVSVNDGEHHVHKGLGLVGDVFGEPELNALPGKMAIGHVRYSTTGQNLLTNAQPLQAELAAGPLALAHNGNLVNALAIRRELQQMGSIFQGTTDTEIFLHLISRSENARDPRAALKGSLAQVIGAYSLVVMTKDELMAVRDPLGFRPLVLGTKANAVGETSYVIASESCALDLIGAKLIREIAPGEMVWINKDGLSFEQVFPVSSKKAQCVFEHVYFARPDSVVFGRSVYESRKAFGRFLAKENPVDADIVIPVPDSGVPAALGYAEESRIPFELGIIRNHYVGRTFIQPHQSVRSFGVKIKLNPQSSVLSGQRVVVIDDSLVRGTTSQKIIRLIRQAGAKEVHMRIASPPTVGPCYYGVDTPQKSSLIAANQSLEEIREFIEADSLGYLSLEGMFTAIRSSNEQYCAACFDGNYPTAIDVTNS